MADNISVTGVKVQEAADPVTDNDIIDTDDTELIDDADEDFEDDAADEETPVPTGKAKPIVPAAPDQNAVYADIRRKAETEAKVKATQEANRNAQVQIDKVFSDMGLNDPYTGKPITTKAEYDAYKERHESEKIGSELTKAGISRESLDALISSHPALKKAETAAKAYEQAKQHEQELAAKTHFDSQLKEISALDPDIKTVDDFMNQPNYETIRGYVKKGLTIVESYRLANMDKLSTKQSQAAAQTAYNKSASKDHLTSTAVRGQGEAPISKKQMEMYRMTTGMTDKEIRADYTKYKQKYK